MQNLPITIALLMSFARLPLPTSPKRCTVPQNDSSTGDTIANVAADVPTSAPRIPSAACALPPVRGASANPTPAASSCVASSAVETRDEVPVSRTVWRPATSAGAHLSDNSLHDDRVGQAEHDDRAALDELEAIGRLSRAECGEEVYRRAVRVPEDGHLKPIFQEAGGHPLAHLTEADAAHPGLLCCCGSR